jgi:hypothetical protein
VLHVSRDLEATVQSILRSAPSAEEADTPEPIREVARIRSAALRILEDEVATAEAKSGLIRRLFDACAAATLPAWARQAIRYEIDWYFGREPRPHVPTAVTAARRLRRAGYRECPTCRIAVMDEIQIRAFEDADRSWLAEETAHEQAAPKGAS